MPQAPDSDVIPSSEDDGWLVVKATDRSRELT
jgi:hypothetical protein